MHVCYQNNLSTTKIRQGNIEVKLTSFLEDIRKLDHSSKGHWVQLEILSYRSLATIQSTLCHCLTEGQPQCRTMIKSNIKL